MWQLVHLECDRLTQTFSRLQCPQLLQSTINNFVTKNVSGDPTSTQACNVNQALVRIVLPFKDQRSANCARRQLGELGRKIGIDTFAPGIQDVRSDTRSNRKKRSRLSLTSNALFTTTTVVCAMQTVLDIRAETSISASEIGNHIKTTRNNSK